MKKNSVRRALSYEKEAEKLHLDRKNRELEEDLAAAIMEYRLGNKWDVPILGNIARPDNMYAFTKPEFLGKFPPTSFFTKITVTEEPREVRFVERSKMST